MSEDKPKQETKPVQKEEKALVSEEDAKKIAMLRVQGGEGMKSINAKYVNFHGKEGFFYETVKNEQGENEKKQLGTNFTGIIILQRYRISKFAEGTKYSSREFDGLTEKVDIYEDRRQIASGSYKELKAKMPNKVGMERILYVKQPDSEQVIKLTVKGLSLSNLFTFLSGFDGGDSSARYTTDMKAVKVKTDFGESFAIEFSRGAKQDLDYCLELQTGLKETLKMIEESVAPVDKKEEEEVDLDREDLAASIPF